MTAGAIAASVLLALAVAVVLACMLGVHLMSDAMQRVHYVTPAATVAPLLIGVAFVVEEPSAWPKLLVIVVALSCANAIVAPATARALLIRARGRWPPSRAPAEQEEP